MGDTLKLLYEMLEILSLNKAELVASKDAIGAYKKQIPLMPVQNFYLKGDYLEGDYLLECPICKNILGEGQIYCTDCGQRLEWEE